MNIPGITKNNLPILPYGFQNSPIEIGGYHLLSPARYSYQLWNGRHGTLLKRISAVALGSITCLLTLIGLVLRELGSRFPVRTARPLLDTDIPATSPVKIEQLYELLAITSELFEEHGITYFMQSGTLLGSARYGGLMRHDDDADLGIFEEDREKLLQLEAALLQRGVELYRTHEGATIYRIRFTKEHLRREYGVEDVARDSAQLDIDLFTRLGNGQVLSKNVRTGYPGFSFTEEELENLPLHDFGPGAHPLQLRGVADPTRYLKAAYGREWDRYAVSTHTHIRIGDNYATVRPYVRTKYLVQPDTPCAEGVSDRWKHPKV